jgi:hypothetical protein
VTTKNDAPMEPVDAVTPPQPSVVPAMMKLDLPGALDRYRGADIDPIVKPFGRIATRQRHSNAAMGSGPVGN